MLIDCFRESNTLRRQVEQMLQKLSPLEKCQEELDSVKAELEEKKVTSCYIRHGCGEVVLHEDGMQRGEQSLAVLTAALNDS